HVESLLRLRRAIRFSKFQDWQRRLQLAVGSDCRQQRDCLQQSQSLRRKAARAIECRLPFRPASRRLTYRKRTTERLSDVIMQLRKTKTRRRRRSDGPVKECS